MVIKTAINFSLIILFKTCVCSQTLELPNFWSLYPHNSKIEQEKLTHLNAEERIQYNFTSFNSPLYDFSNIM